MCGLKSLLTPVVNLHIFAVLTFYTYTPAFISVVHILITIVE